MRVRALVRERARARTAASAAITAASAAVRASTTAAASGRAQDSATEASSQPLSQHRTDAPPPAAAVSERQQPSHCHCTVLPVMCGAALFSHPGGFGGYRGPVGYGGGYGGPVMGPGMGYYPGCCCTIM